VMDARLQRLQAALNRDQLAFNQATIGKTCAVLIERQGKLPGQMLGKSPWLQSVYLNTDAKIGDMVEVEITGGFGNSLTGVEKLRAAA
jgi:tRNA-2-methylthio-N6-dimethylallyladenosine synthase